MTHMKGLAEKHDILSCQSFYHLSIIIDPILRQQNHCTYYKWAQDSHKKEIFIIFHLSLNFNELIKFSGIQHICKMCHLSIMNYIFLIISKLKWWSFKVIEKAFTIIYKIKEFHQNIHRMNFQFYEQFE